MIMMGFYFIGVVWVRFFLGESRSRLYPHMRAKFGRNPTAGSKKVTFKCISRFPVYAICFDWWMVGQGRHWNLEDGRGGS